MLVQNITEDFSGPVKLAKRRSSSVYQVPRIGLMLLAQRLVFGRKPFNNVDAGRVLVFKFFLASFQFREVTGMPSGYVNNLRLKTRYIVGHGSKLDE